MVLTKVINKLLTILVKKMINEPLFLPKGSVRAILILGLTAYIIISLYNEKVVHEMVITIWAGMIGWYYGGKLNNNKNKENEQ